MPKKPPSKATDPKAGPTLADPRLAYPILEACKLLGLSRATLYQLIKAGDLLTFTQGRRRLVSKAALEAYITRREAAELATLPVSTPPAPTDPTTSVYPLSPFCTIRS